MPVAAKDLTYTYMPGSPFEHTALSHVDLEIADGEYLGIIGQTGSGKTTLIKLLSGLLSPTSGSVLLDGEDIFKKGYDKKKIRAKVGVVFQYPEYQLFEETVYKDIAYGPKRQGLSEEEVAQRVSYACSLLDFDIERFGERSPFELSGGQKRRAAIAGVAAMRPRILILDEPVAGLDPVGREDLFSFIRRFSEEGNTVVLITHSMDDLAGNVRRVVALHDGAIALDGTAKQVFSDVSGLRELGLTLPQAAKIAELMRRRGIDVPRDIVTPEELIAFVRSALC